MNTLYRFLVLALLTGCANSPEPRYYTLGVPPPASTSNATAKTARNISLGPISIPEVVDRPQIVLQTGPHRVAMLEQHRWAQPLKSEISRVVSASLMQQVNGAWVTDFRNGLSRDLDYRVSIDVQRFESLPGEEVTIEALWIVRRMSDGETWKGKSLVREIVSDASYEALVAAHGKALIAVSSEIAVAIRSAGADATASRTPPK